MGKKLKVVLTRSVQTVLFSLAVRVFLYAVLLGVLAGWMLWGAVVYDEAFYDECGPVEVLESVSILLTAIVFLTAARIDPKKVPCSIMLAGSLFCVFIRESDYSLDTLIARHSWKIGVTLILILMVFYAIRYIREIYSSVLDFVNLPSFGIFISGALVLFVFSRLFGYGSFWKAIMDDSSYRTVKTIVEEGVEQMGYFLMVISSCEYLHDARITRKYPGSLKGLEHPAVS